MHWEGCPGTGKEEVERNKTGYLEEEDERLLVWPCPQASAELVTCSFML